MSSATGLKTTDGQRLTARMAALCGPSTHTVNLAARRPAPLRAVLAQTFALVTAQHAGDAESRDLTIPAGTGTSPLRGRLYTPAGLEAQPGLIVFFHGGGFVFGDIKSHDNGCRFLAKRAGAKVLSVDYRLAPEHRFPAAFEDAVAAFGWAGDNAAQLGVDPARIAVGGDSAGGNLAAGVALHADARPSFALLIYPLVDADLDRHPSTHLFAKGPLLTRQALVNMVGVHYAPSPRAQLDPRMSVIDAPNLDAMPPTFIATAGMDPLRDQGEAFADKLRAAGVQVEAQRFDNLPHGFFSLLIDPDARRAAEIVAGAASRALQRRATAAPTAVR